MRGPALLFCPADRPDRYAKAAAAADTVILDLEDAVGATDKPRAREALREVPLDPDRTIVRVNPAATPDLELDLRALAETPYRTVMLAKTENPGDVDALAGYEVVALCETALGVENAFRIARHASVEAMFWGAEDLVASLSGRTSRHAGGTYRDIARMARARVLLAAGAAGKPAIDSVHLDIGDVAGLRAEALDAAGSGFWSTACIHPSQVATIREAYAASDEELAWAKRVLAEAATQSGVFRFEGRMVDEPVLRQARHIVAGQGATSRFPGV